MFLYKGIDIIQLQLRSRHFTAVPDILPTLGKSWENDPLT